MIRPIKNARELAELKDSIVSQRDARKQCISVCCGTGCRASDSVLVKKGVEAEVAKQGLKSEVTVKSTGCHGFCEHGPIIVISPKEIFYERVKTENAGEIVRETLVKNNIIPHLLYTDPATGEKIKSENEIPFYKKQRRRILEKNRLIDPTSISDYIAEGGYEALAKALLEMKPEEIIGEVKKSGLRGRGGAGFPTGFKWDFCRKAKGDRKYIICNADEGDPGAYMDRSILEGNPHSVIEGMIIGAYAIGADEGVVYVRNEYPLAVSNLKAALAQAKGYGLLGKNILGSSFQFDIAIERGAGAFVCGEETALITSIAGRRGEPRQRPPFPATRGFRGKPTNINNVETWANVALIINKGADWYSRIGTEGSKGTKIFSLVGKVNNTGLVEVPMGTTLREIIYDIGGGIKGDGRFKAVQTGGPSGGCIPKGQLDLPIDYESLTAAGSIMGSGGMIVMDDSTCMVDVAKYFLNFLRDESCGKCLSCREGTQRLWEILSGICEGKGAQGDIALLEELALAVKDASMCGLGQTASNSVLSTLRYFRDEYEEHVLHKKCRAFVCGDLVGAPCQTACPLGTEAWRYAALIEKGRYQEAYKVIRENNPFPSVCARVCDHKCETRCKLGATGGEPLAIRALKRFVTDTVDPSAYGPAKAVETVRDRAKVAVVGAGPAGLAAAHYLSLAGCKVTVFEAEQEPGGMLMSCIPAYRLPGEAVRKEIKALLNESIALKCGVALGRDITLDGIFKDGFKAVFLAMGANESLKLNIEGEDTEGIYPSMRFLKGFNLKEEKLAFGHVGVIGGGNSAVDAARVALRQEGVKSVTIFYRRTRREMPAYEEEIVAALEEGVNLETLVSPVKIHSKDGRLVGARCIKNKLGDFDSSGRRSPVPLAGSEFDAPLDTLIVAVGEQPASGFLKAAGLKLHKNGRLCVDEATLCTNRQGVFAGGDIVTGPNTVVDAIAAGKKAAEIIRRHLNGEDLKIAAGTKLPEFYIEPAKISEKELAEAKRVRPTALPAEKRKKSFAEAERAISAKDACREARRCLRCDLKFTQKEEVESGRNGGAVCRH